MPKVGVIAASLLLCAPHRASSFAPTSNRRRPATTSRSSSQFCSHDYRTITTALNGQSSNSNEEQLHLLTFDLDDTIFPIGPVVADANVAQLRTLVKFGYDDACNDQIIAASKQIRTELREAGSAITYTELRKRSIRREIERLTCTVPGSEERVVHESVIEATFDAWLSERHASADRNLFPHASDALSKIKERHPTAIVGAITNGRGNPLDMPSVASYFDFCVSGEDDGVFPRRKPDEGIYRAAIERYNTMQGDQRMTDFNWIHVGDDLANDVGASAASGAKAIWFAVEEEDDVPSELPSWSTATKEELEKRAAMDEVAREHVSARVGSLEGLPDAILEVLGL